MIKKITFSIFFLLIFISFSSAGTPQGGLVTYRSLGNFKYEVTYKIYRDCRSIPLTITTYTIRCASSGSTKNLTATRVGINDITNSCPLVSKICNPANQTISGSNPAYEEHIYKDTLDFNGSESAFKSCCSIQIGAGQCCRSGGISTGAAGNDFWVYSTLDLCKGANNSSPIFALKPNFIAMVNQPFMQSYLARDTIDNDSLSYSFTDPKTSWTGKTSWSGGLDSKNPFSAYYPSSYNKANGPKPEATPPIGIYLDPNTGILVGQAINSSENTIMAISVKEWRKDTTGKYNQIGEIIMDHPILCITSVNHQPTLKANFSYNICEGQKFSIDIPSDDQPFTQPPPASSILNDTVSISWIKSIKNASYSITNPNAKLPVGRFEWTPATGDSKKPFYSFTILANDNNCLYRGTTARTVQLNVYPKISVSSTIKKINNTTYATSLNIGNKKYNYVTGKYITSSINGDIRNYYFKSSSALYSNNEVDTLIFKRNGTYIVNQSFISATDCNTVTIKDTIVVSNILEVTFGYDILGIYNTDTSVCLNQSARMLAKVTNAKKPVTYQWKINKFTQSDTFGFLNYSFSKSDTLFVSVKDANGSNNSTFRYVNVLEVPDIFAGNDVTICPEGQLKIIAKNKKTDPVTWAWYYSANKISGKDTVLLSSKGYYIVKATNSVGCVLTDTLRVQHFNPIQISLISGVYCQAKNELNHSEIITGLPNLNFNSITWKLIKSMPKITGGENTLSDILTDKNPNKDFDFYINFNQTKVAFVGNQRDSFIFIGTSIDTNFCKTSDTMIVALLKQPDIFINKKINNYCINQIIFMDSLGKSSHPFQWLPFYRNGFGNWPSYLPLASNKIAANYFSMANKYKIKLQASNSFCLNTDSILLNVFALPHPIINVFKYPNSIRYRDQTINVNSRNWYINNVYFSSDDTLLLSKSFAHLQPIKLEVIDNYGCTNDTTIIIDTQAEINKYTNSPIIVFPNPANEYIIIKQKDTWKPTSYYIYNAIGDLLLTGKTNQRDEIINLRTMQSGVYYLKYFSDTEIFSSSFIKTK